MELSVRACLRPLLPSGVCAYSGSGSCVGTSLRVILPFEQVGREFLPSRGSLSESAQEVKTLHPGPPLAEALTLDGVSKCILLQGFPGLTG